MIEPEIGLHDYDPPKLANTENNLMSTELILVYSV